MSSISYPPLTVETAVHYLQANLASNYEFQLATMNKADFDERYYSLGAYAAGMLGLWSGNEELIASCRLVSGNEDLDADEAALLIVGLLWERLHGENKLS